VVSPLKEIGSVVIVRDPELAPMKLIAAVPIVFAPPPPAP
jgi:hypothetical protein